MHWICIIHSPTCSPSGPAREREREESAVLQIELLTVEFELTNCVLRSCTLFTGGHILETLFSCEVYEDAMEKLKSKRKRIVTILTK